MDTQEASKTEQDAAVAETGQAREIVVNALATDDKNIQDTFKALAQEEAKHKLRLELIYDDEIMKEN